MSKTLKKTLSIIIAILMIVTTIPMAFAAEETPDFSDAKVLSTNNGYLYIDGEKISVVYNTFNDPIQNIPGGKYILGGDMNSSGAYAHTLSDAVSINLNGYTWDFGKKYLSLYGALSIYDTSIEETGKITSSFQRTIDLRDGSELNLYSGTVENNSENDYSYSLQALKGTANLYGGKLKSNKYAIDCNLRNPEIINLVGTVLESGEGYGQLRTPVTLYDDEIPEIVVDVSDYNGIDLTLQLDFYGYTDYVGKYTLIKGVENAEEAEKYKIKINYPEDQPDVYVEEIGYDEATGEIYLYTATNAFTQQPSVENDYTVDFNNPDVSFQWCEVEEKNLGVYTAEEFLPLFTYEFKAGDILKVSTDSEIDFVVLKVGDEYLELENDSKTAMIKIDADETIEIFSSIIDSENSVDIEFSVIKETALEGETEKTLQKVECGKSYYCKATVGENVYISDTVNILPVEHDLIQVDAKAPTCSAAGYEAYEYCTACDYTTYKELPKEIFHKDADKNNKCDDCSAELAFEINRNGELLYYDNPYIQGFQALYDAAQDGDVITLLRDVFAYTIEIRKELTYDLNGFNIKTASSRSINIYDNVTIRDSVGGGEIYLAVYIAAPCTIEGGIFNSLGVASGITLDSILSPCAGYYDYKGNAIDTTGKKSINYAYVIENHTEGDIYNCLGYKCAVCEKYYGEPNPDGHEYTEGVCDLCGYDCPHEKYTDGVCDVCGYECAHEWGEGAFTRPTRTEEGCYTYTCSICKDTKIELVERASNYAEFKELLEKVKGYLDENLTDSMMQEVNNVINFFNLDENHRFIKGEENTVSQMIRQISEFVEVVEEGIADGTAVKVNGLEEIVNINDKLNNELAEKYGEDVLAELVEKIGEKLDEEFDAVYEKAEALKGSVAENKDALDEIEAEMEAIFAEVENCLNGTHNGLKFEVTEEAKCGVNAVESATCTLCGETDEREVENSALTHIDENGDYACDNGCGYEYENPEETCPDCGRPVHEGGLNNYICILIMIIKTIITVYNMINA